MPSEKATETKRKADQILPYGELMAEILAFCAGNYISVGIGFERMRVKGQWEANQTLDLPFMIEVFKECKRDTIKKDDCQELLYLKEKLTAFENQCNTYKVGYFWIFSFEDRVFYDLEHTGNLKEHKPDIMWKIELLSPGYVEKKIRAPKEPIREALLALNDLPRGSITTTDDIGDVSEIYDSLYEPDNETK